MILAPLTLALTLGPQSEPTPTPQLKEEVIVTASRVETSARDSAANITVLKEAEIHDAVGFGTDDMLRRVPGFSLFRQASGLVGSPATNSVSLRGLGGSSASRTLVLVDGVPLFDPYYTGAPFQRVPTEWIDRVEIVRGGGSVAWGNLALGGVINLRTFAGSTSQMKIGVSGGEGGLLRTTVSGALGRRRFGGSVIGLYSDFDGYKIIREDQRGSIDERAGSTQKDLALKGHWEPGERWRLHAGASVFSEDMRRGTPLVRDHSGARAVRADGEYVAASGDSVRALFSYTSQTGAGTASTIAADRQSETPSADQYERPGSVFTASLGWSRLVGARHLLSAGADFLSSSAGIKELNTPVAGVFLRERTTEGSPRLFGLFAQSNSPVGSRFRVNAAVRVDSFSYRDMQRTDTIRATGQVLRNDTFEKPVSWTVNPSLGLVFLASPEWTLKASVYRAFRSPAISELINPFRASGNVVGEGNPFLTPEFVTGLEGGARRASPTGWVGVTGFVNMLQDPIATVTVGQAGRTATTIEPCGLVAAGGSCRVRENLGRLRSVGVEFDGQQRIGGFVVDAAYFWNTTRILDAAAVPGLEGKENRNAPRHQVSFGIAYTNPRTLTLSMRGRYVGSRFDDDLNTLVLAGFFVADARASRTWNRRIETWAAVENLLDEVSEVATTSTGVFTIGAPRLFRVGVRLQF